MWWEKLEFEKNPFSTSPDDFEPFGLDKFIEDLSYRIEAGSIAFIEGSRGTGKSSLLKAIISRFSGKGKVIFFDCKSIERDVNIENLMKERYGFFGKLFNIIPRGMILLLDNMQFLSRKNAERIKYYFDNNYIKSAIFAGESYKRAALPKGLKERIGNRVTALKPLSEDQAVEAIKARIGSRIMATEIIRRIYRLSGKNIIKCLENCGRICEKYIKNSEDSISESNLKEFFGDKHGTVV